MVLLMARLRHQIAHTHLLVRHCKNKAAKLRRERDKLRAATERLLRLRFGTQKFLEDRLKEYYEIQIYLKAIRQQQKKGPIKGWIPDECET